eukprot:CAMPEP_0194383244 /NCGR_PEP_ID=MMETSP0174-20130528/66121_1 /TAXON_ID=216777 /ORGANISM="Proboscia alata, Strain PI-D3" /LENGTH=552 /DNA_ID=CAMNT_0039169297 /DNA_START=99 /DNA_END=1757 /DNA_ORIENTATION=-
MRFFLLISFLLSKCSHRVFASSFVQPAVWDVNQMENNTIELNLDWLEVDPGFGGPAYETRVLGGSFPGPTILVFQNTTIKVTFNNKLTRQSEAKFSSESGRKNDISDPDTGNLHFHGGHVTSVLPGDDTTLVVGPGESYDYIIPVLEEHAPGLHWIHPHHHGSTSLHVGGGAASAFIVRDPPGFLPPQLEDAAEKVMVFQDIDMFKLQQQALRANDERFRRSMLGVIDSKVPGHSDLKNRFVTINGVYQPTLTMTSGKWQRWRMLFAGWRTSHLAFRTLDNGADCEFQLLAKDGVYLSDFPRPVGELLIPTGGRADVMVRCNSVGSTTYSAIDREVMRVVVEELEGSSMKDNDLIPWAPEVLPKYLQDLTTSKVSPGCSCDTKFSGEGDHSYVNGRSYLSGNHYLHSSYLGAVVERHLSFEKEHSYHQHVYPFQLVSDNFSSNYFQMGDWHDSYMDGDRSAAIRYRPTVLSGKIMIHCHNNIHSDRGMLAKEYVLNITNGQCQCDIFGSISGSGIVDDVGPILQPISAPNSGASRSMMTILALTGSAFAAVI